MEVTTSTWTYVVVLLVVGKFVLTGRDRLKAKKAESVTGVPAQTVLRLAAEVRTPADAARAVVRSDDDVQDAREAIDRTIEAGEDDVVGVNPGVNDDTDEGKTGFEWGHDTVNPEPVENNGDGENATNDTDDGEELGFIELFKMWRMDTAAALNKDDWAWHFAVPVVAIVAAAVVALQLWLHPIVYVGLAGLGAFVGGLNLIRVRRKRLRRLDSLRTERTTPSVDMVSVLVKTVDTRSMTLYVAWVGGHRYASTDRAEFVDGVAKRGLQYARGDDVAPSIMEHYVEELASLRPDLAAYRDFEEYRTAQDLVDVVRENGLVPREKLIEETVQYGSGGRLWDPEQAFGHDPSIVTDMYLMLVPEVLVQESVEITNTQGETRDVPAVRMRDDPLPHDLADVRARFSSVYSNYNTGGERYNVPDPETPDGPAVRVSQATVSDD
ncbi:hypothetical protein C478_07332 [Natrinema thermotolerans DSM 11552]|nr:hypothetical protein C478_07332 [Natrinema thermotolerans DSM 11552]